MTEKTAQKEVDREDSPEGGVGLTEKKGSGEGIGLTKKTVQKGG